MKRLGVWMLILGACALVVAYDRGKLGKGYAAQAREVRPEALVSSDLSSNRHVRLTGFRLNLNETVYMTKKGQTDWTTVYVPVASYSQPPQLQVLVTTKRVKNESELNSLGQRPELEGMIVNGVDSLNDKARDLLVESFPNAHFPDVVLLDLDRTDPGSPLPPLLGGLALAIGGVVSMLRR